jgi:hypothetical protein
MCASKVAEGGRRGWIIPIGGAEEKENSPQILRRFVDLAGGGAADIAVIPTASLVRDTGPRYERIFGEMGAPGAMPRRAAASSASIGRPGFSSPAATSSGFPPCSEARRWRRRCGC